MTNGERTHEGIMRERNPLLWKLADLVGSIGKGDKETKGQKDAKAHDTLQFVNAFKASPRDAFQKYSAQQITFFREEAFKMGLMTQEEYSKIWQDFKKRDDESRASTICPPKK